VIAQVPDRLRPHATRPHIAVGRDLRRRDACHARNDLAMLAQGPLHQLVVLPAKRLRHLSHTGQLPVPHALQQRVNRHRVALGRGCYPQSHRVQLDPLLGDLGYERIRLQLTLDVATQLRKRVNVEVGYDCVDAQRQMRMPLLQVLQGGVGLHRVRPVFANAANLVVFGAHAVQGEVDHDLGPRRGL
jgi:hypothetical protein